MTAPITAVVLFLWLHLKWFVSAAAHKAGGLPAEQASAELFYETCLSVRYLPVPFKQSLITCLCLCQAVLSEDLWALVALEALQREEVERPAAESGLLLLRRGPGNPQTPVRING